MTYGHSNAPATFEQLIKTVLGGLTYESSRVHLDDVILIGRTIEEHLLNLRTLFQHFREAHLKLKPENFQRFLKEVRYLGHIISLDRVTTESEKLKTVWDWSSPKNKYEIRSFLCI